MPFDLPDLSSFASSLLPAVAGGLTGGPAGAAYGLAAGLAGNEKNRLDLAKENANIQFQNIQANQAQERIGLQREQQAAAETHLGYLNRGIDDGLKTAELNRKKTQFDLDIAMKDEKGFDSFFAANPQYNEADRRLLKANPVAFTENKFHDDVAIEATANAIKSYKLHSDLTPRDQAIAWGPKVSHQFILAAQKGEQDMAKAQLEHRTAGLQPWRAIPTTDGIIKVNQQTGDVVPRTWAQLGMDNPSSKPEQRVRAMQAFRQRFHEEKDKNPQMLGGIEFEDWVKDPILQTELAYASGDLRPAEYESAMDNGRQMKLADEKTARDKMYAAWAEKYKHDPKNPETVKLWTQYWTDEKTRYGAQGIFNQWLKVERKDRGWKTTPPKETGASLAVRPVQMGEGSVGMNDLPSPPQGKMLIENTKTGQRGMYPVGDVPPEFRRLR